jgi:ribose-phosphate pyrophosphokinase
MDDIVSTGGTIAERSSCLKSGRREVHVACVHAVWSERGPPNNGGMRSILSADTLEKATSKVSVAPIIAEAVKK